MSNYTFHPFVEQENGLLVASSTKWDHLKQNYHCSEIPWNLCNTVPVNHLHYSTTGSCQKGSKQMHCPNPDVNYLCSTTTISLYIHSRSLARNFKSCFPCRKVTMHWFRKLSREKLTTSPQWLVVENHSWIYMCKKNVVCTFISCNFYFVIIFPLLHECRESVEDELARISMFYISQVQSSVSAARWSMKRSWIPYLQSVFPPQFKYQWYKFGWFFPSFPHKVASIVQLQSSQ